MKPIVLTGRTEIIAAIYDNEHLPSAIISSIDTDNPHCLHSLREAGLDFFEETMRRWRTNDGLEEEDEDELQVNFYKFYEHFPSPSGACHGCYYAKKAGVDNIVEHRISQSEDACTKLTSDCA